MSTEAPEDPYRFQLRPCFAIDRESRSLRLLKVLYRRHGGPGSYGGYSARIEFGLTPRLLGWRHVDRDWRLILLLVRIHYHRSEFGWLR